MTGAALCELQSADFVASTAFHLVKPRSASTALEEPQSADYAHTLIHSQSLALSHCLTPSRSLSHSLSLTLTLTLTLSQTHPHSLTLTHTHTLIEMRTDVNAAPYARPRFQVTKKRVRARHLQSLQHQAHVQSSPALYCSTTKCRNNALDSFGQYLGSLKQVHRADQALLPARVDSFVGCSLHCALHPPAQKMKTESKVQSKRIPVTTRGTHTLMDMHTELKAVPHAGLGFQFLRVHV